MRNKLTDKVTLISRWHERPGPGHGAALHRRRRGSSSSLAADARSDRRRARAAWANAAGVRSLASDDSSFVNGIELFVTAA